MSPFPWRFFALVFVLSLPLWIVGEVTALQLAPGLPISALAAFSPAAAAVILTLKEQGVGGAARLLRRTFDWQRIRPVWYVPIFLLVPVISVVSYSILQALGRPLPAPQISFIVVPMSVAFFIGAAGEEIGWSGYAIDRLQSRWSALKASLVLGIIGAVWHFVPLAQVHRDFDWVAWWSLCAVTGRVLTVWIYNNTGKSVLAATLFHATFNVSWQMFPISGSHYDPRSMGLLLLSATTIIAILWGPATLTRFSFSRPSDCGRNTA